MLVLFPFAWIPDLLAEITLQLVRDLWSSYYSQNCHWLYLFNASSKSRFSTLSDLVHSAAASSSVLASMCHEELATASPRAWGERDLFQWRRRDLLRRGRWTMLPLARLRSTVGSRVSVPTPIFWIWWESIFFNPAAWFIGVDLWGNLFPMRKRFNYDQSRIQRQIQIKIQVKRSQMHTWVSMRQRHIFRQRRPTLIIFGINLHERHRINSTTRQKYSNYILVDYLKQVPPVDA